jgi:hypothetical protein
MSWPLGERVVVRRKTGVTQDGDGNDVPEYTPQTIEGVAIGPATTVELVQGQQLVVTELHAIFQPAVAMAAGDELDVETGLSIGSYAIDGDPKQYKSPLTGTSVTDARLRKVTG